MKRSALACLALVVSVATAEIATAADGFPPSPYDILRNQDLETPLLDAVQHCVPPGLDEAVAPVLEQAQAQEWREARSALADWTSGLDAPGIKLVTLDAVYRPPLFGSIFWGEDSTACVGDASKA